MDESINEAKYKKACCLYSQYMSDKSKDKLLQAFSEINDVVVSEPSNKNAMILQKAIETALNKVSF